MMRYIASKSPLLERLDLGQSSFALFHGMCADHLTDGL